MDEMPTVVVKVLGDAKASCAMVPFTEEDIPVALNRRQLCLGHLAVMHVIYHSFGPVS